MHERLTTDFNYLAFDCISGTLLAHGRTAAHAAQQADQVAPEAYMKIITAGAAGLDIWKAQMTHREAAEILTNQNKRALSC